MKRLTLLGLVLSAALLILAVAPAAATARNEFRGAWTGIDGDGSNMKLWFVQDGWSAGRLIHIRGSDDRTGGWCGGAARMDAIGVLEGDDALSVSYAWWCLDPVENILYFYGDTFTYDTSADTITAMGVEFHRAK